jgi:PAS domain S-box-containing protein
MESRDIILDSINEGVFTVDGRWRLTSFNRAAERITGVPREEAIGRKCCEVFRASICEGSCALRETMRTGRPAVNLPVYIIDAEGRKVPIRISAAVLRDESGEMIGGVETFQDLTQLEQLRKQIESDYTFSDIVGRSHAMRELFALLPQVASSRSTVLLRGATGTGKELIARAIHNLSDRREGPFVAVNCGALPDTLLESELFGYKAGAFTDARGDKPGRFALAAGGTIFLDEIGDVSPAMQTRLLRVLQEHEYEPLGSVEPEEADVRVIAATHRDLRQLVAEGGFREDLFYRVRVVQLDLPALKQRREDLPLLADHFVRRFNTIQGRDVPGVSDAAMRLLMEHDWPGNVRELENVIEHAFVLCGSGLIRPEHLPPELRGPGPSAPSPPGEARSLEVLQREAIRSALQRNDGSRTAAARELGISASTLYRKIRSLEIELPDSDGRTREAN